jgi:hypothetical protein
MMSFFISSAMGPPLFRYGGGDASMATVNANPNDEHVSQLVAHLRSRGSSLLIQRLAVKASTFALLLSVVRCMCVSTAGSFFAPMA